MASPVQFYIQRDNYKDSFTSLASFKRQGEKYHFFSLPRLASSSGIDLSRLPFSIRVLIENLLRHEDSSVVTADDIHVACTWKPNSIPKKEIQFFPTRVLLQDFTGVPALADLAAMRSYLKQKGLDPSLVNPKLPVDLIIDHSIQVDEYGSAQSLKQNSSFEMARNRERYEFIKWGQNTFHHFRVVPPETGICHQVNLELLAQVATSAETHSGEKWVFFDSLIGTDSHTPMVNGLGVLGWGVGGIEAEAAMLGQPCTLLLPEVLGFKLTGQLPSHVTATDLVLTVTQILRKKGVVGKFVEFIGDGVRSLDIADRATLSNMAPEYGATIGFWPVDQNTVNYLHLTGRSFQAELTEAYYKEQMMWWDDSSQFPDYTDLIELDLSTVEPSVSGPSRPHDRTALHRIKEQYESSLLKDKSDIHKKGIASAMPVNVNELTHGHIVIAAITSCTNTSNPKLMLAAGLLARNAIKKGLTVPSWVKTSFAPGSLVVSDYLSKAGLMTYLEQLGFYLVGYGCTTCIGNSGPLSPDIEKVIQTNSLNVVSVLSGNRNFEARIHPLVRSNYLASPPLVVAFALAGRINIDFKHEPLGKNSMGRDIFLNDLWPSPEETANLQSRNLSKNDFQSRYKTAFVGSNEWQKLDVPNSEIYLWKKDSTYIQRPPFFDLSNQTQLDKWEGIKNARILAKLGDFTTTDHISPAGSIAADSPAGRYLQSLGIAKKDFNSYGSRRGNHEVMARGTFANVRIRNQVVTREGGFTVHWPSDKEMSIYDAAQLYLNESTPLVVFAGREYGSGSSRDWAAKGPRLLGVRAVVASSFERIHRSNLIGLGILPLELPNHLTIDSLELNGREFVSLSPLGSLQPNGKVSLTLSDQEEDISKAKGNIQGTRSIETTCRIDTDNELKYFLSGGILSYVANKYIRENEQTKP